MFSRASHWLVTCFPALRTDWLHVFPCFALTGYMFSRASHWLVTRFLALGTDWLHVFPCFALSGYTFSRAWHWLVTFFLALCTDWLHVFPRLARFTLDKHDQNEFNFGCITATRKSLYHSSIKRSRQWLTQFSFYGFESRWSPDFFQASSFQLLKLENILRWSFFNFIYNRSSYMHYFI